MSKTNLCFHMGYASLSDKYGSELSLMNLANQFKLYYNVFIFSTNCQQEEDFNGIRYMNGRLFEEFSATNAIDLSLIHI